MLAAADQLPTIVDVLCIDGEDVELGAAAPVLSVLSCWTWMFDVGEGGFVLAVALDVALHDDVPTSDGVAALFDDFDTGRWARRIGGRPLAALAGLELSFDFHAVICLPDSERERLTPDAVQALVSRRWHLSSPRFVSASLADRSNPFVDGVVAVTPGASLVCGAGDDFAVAAIICAALAVSAVATLRDLQQEVYRTALSLTRLGSQVVDPDRDWGRSRELDALARNMADHELDLSLAVERFTEIRIFLPVWRVEQYHRLLLDALGVERATTVTATMLRRVSAAVDAENAILESQRWRWTERRRRTLSAVGGAAAFIAIPLTIILGFLSISVEPVGSEDSAVRMELLPYYGLLLGLLALACGAAWCFARRYPDHVGAMPSSAAVYRRPPAGAQVEGASARNSRVPRSHAETGVL
jgi:hypothetical protein